jgi:hypothetical protein
MAFLSDTTFSTQHRATGDKPLSRMLAGLKAHLRPAAAEQPALRTLHDYPQVEDLKSAEFDRMAGMGSWSDVRDTLRAQSQGQTRGHKAA